MIAEKTIGEILDLPSSAAVGLSDFPSIRISGAGVDPVAVIRAPLGECARVDIDPNSDVALSLIMLLRLFGEVHKLLPRSGQIAAVFEDRAEGVIFRLPANRNTDAA
jgi:hypothetical protein